jgi:hypothetical protein
MIPLRQFHEAGLKLEESATPFGSASNQHVFGLDIQGDRFRMWKPEHVITQVQARDAKMRQVVLTVKEPLTTFTLEVPKHLVAPRDRVLRTFKSGRSVVAEVERKTSPETRYFLCGVDERNHPFIAQLPGIATSVQKAHELLKPQELRGQKVKGHGKNVKVRGKKKTVYRQGEWFMLPLNVDDLAGVEAYAQKHGTVKAVRLGGRMGRGKPHTADEQIVVPDGVVVRAAVYMRGKLRHVEHDTLDFPNWVRVVRNTEVGGATQGATWVD